MAWQLSKQVMNQVTGGPCVHNLSLAAPLIAATVLSSKQAYRQWIGRCDTPPPRPAVLRDLIVRNHGVKRVAVSYTFVYLNAGGHGLKVPCR